MKKDNKLEGNVYRCTWKKRGRSFVVSSLPPISAESSGLDLGCVVEDLRARIMGLTGDGESILQFEPPLPDLPKARFLPEYHDIQYNEVVDWLQENRQRLFADGICKRCGTGLGLRTDVPRVITNAPRYDVAGFRNDRNVREMFSERVLKHLHPLVKSKIRCIEVQFDEKAAKKVGAKKFYEIDFVPEAEVSVPREHDKITGWRCPRCRSHLYLVSAKKIRSAPSLFISRSFAKGRVLLLGKGPFRVVAIDRLLNEKLNGDKKLKGIVTDRVVILDQQEILSADELNKIKLPAP